MIVCVNEAGDQKFTGRKTVDRSVCGECIGGDLVGGLVEGGDATVRDDKGSFTESLEGLRIGRMNDGALEDGNRGHGGLSTEDVNTRLRIAGARRVFLTPEKG
jgi:hypothetical protein